jgi:hypothetical protein
MVGVGRRCVIEGESSTSRQRRCSRKLEEGIDMKRENDVTVESEQGLDIKQ